MTARFLSCALGAMLSLGALAPARAAPVGASPQPRATIAILHPLEILKKEDLDFGYVAAATGAGTVVIDPETNATSATGGLLLLGGSPHAALFTGAPQSTSVVIIRIPKQPITVTRVGGTETMTVSNWKLQGLDKRSAAARVAFDFRVGATLSVAANQADGLYVGTFDVSIQYP